MDRVHIIMKDSTVILCKMKCIVNGVVEVEELSLVFTPLDGFFTHTEIMIQDGEKIWDKSIINLDEIKSIHYINETKWLEHREEVKTSMQNLFESKIINPNTTRCVKCGTEHMIGTMCHECY